MSSKPVDDISYKQQRKFYNRINWIRKQGKEPIITKLFEKLSNLQSKILEQSLIHSIGRSDLKIGPLTNQTDGGDGCHNLSLESKNKIRLKLLGNKNGLGKKYSNKVLSQETKNKIGKSLKGHPVSNQTCNKISNALKGKIRTQEMVNKWSKKFEITFPDEHKEIILNLKQFCIKHNLSSANMYAVMRGKIKQNKGFKCSRIDPISNKNKGISKKWKIIFPDGHEEIILNLHKFCRDNKLNAGGMQHVSIGKTTNHKGFKCESYE